jgi:hypothetical protein
MPACGRKHPNRPRLGALEHARQIADHAAWPFGQSQLDCPVQIANDITEPTDSLKDHYLTYDMCPDTYLRGCDGTAGRLGRERGRDVCHRPGREQDDVVAEIYGEVGGILGCCTMANSIRWSRTVRTRATEVRE